MQAELVFVACGLDASSMIVLHDSSAAKSRQRQPRAAQNGNHRGKQAWETRRQRQPRKIMKADKTWETKPQRQLREIMKLDKTWEAKILPPLTLFISFRPPPLILNLKKNILLRGEKK